MSGREVPETSIGSLTAPAVPFLYIYVLLNITRSLRAPLVGSDKDMVSAFAQALALEELTLSAGDTASITICKAALRACPRLRRLNLHWRRAALTKSKIGALVNETRKRGQELSQFECVTIDWPSLWRRTCHLVDMAPSKRRTTPTRLLILCSDCYHADGEMSGCTILKSPTLFEDSFIIIVY